MTVTTKLHKDTPVVWVDRVNGIDIGRGKLRAGTEITIDGTKVYGPGGYLFRFEYPET